MNELIIFQKLILGHFNEVSVLKTNTTRKPEPRGVNSPQDMGHFEV